MPKTKDSLTGDASPSTRLSLSSFRNSRSRENPTMTLVPHRGSLYRIDGDPRTTIYIIEILLDKGQVHELQFGREDFEFFSRLFSILDTESRGLVGRTVVKEFVTLRCPVLWRRDDDLRRTLDSRHASNPGYGDSPTFDEVWQAVASCSKTPKLRKLSESLEHVEIGVEAWMVFCRFIALAQYLEAKRRFSARHLQQTMRHRNSPRGSEVVVVDVPPPEPPTSITPQKLAEYERRNNSKLPLPELDLDHSLLAAHDVIRRRHFNLHQCEGTVKICLFGSSSFSSSLMSSTSSASSLSSLEFAVTYTAGSGRVGSKGEQVVVRRSFADMIWLNDTFTSHKVLGGTLCGRILPPFPKTTGSSASSQFPNDENLLQSSIRGTGGAIAAAAASVGMIRDVAISLWGNYVTPSTPSSESVMTSPSSASYKFSKKPAALNFALSENYYNPNSPSGIARQLERFLNYLLDHPALSASFPLNTILKASQSGLEAAKQSLKEHARVSKEFEKQTPHMEDGKLSIPFWPGVSSSSPPNLSWVRTAAQAAMALKVHGLLETTGLPSASARLQHASLPNFDNVSSRNTAWADDEEPPSMMQVIGQADFSMSTILSSGNAEESESFEEGVVRVESELATEYLQEDFDGYDMLPLPVPAPERRILTMGSTDSRQHEGAPASGSSVDGRRQNRFHYGTSSIQTRKSRRDGDGLEDGYLGDISVDENIDKLREVIGSVENILSRCLVSSAGIGAARREKFVLSLDIIKGLDSWEGLRGKIIAQRALMKGVSGLEQSKDVYEESDLALVDDVSWQNALASSAVTAAEDVRSVVRAARTACSAKAAADSAAFAAQTACDTGKFASIEEARAAQTRASIAQSHAIHAAVVEHEAKTVKRRATLALAHDVKCWNVHRKREVLLACIANARSQHEATRRAVDAWSCLRDGYLGSPVIPSQARRVTTPPSPNPPAQIKPLMTDSDEVTTTIYEDVTTSSNLNDVQPSIVAVDHEVLTKIPVEDDLSTTSSVSEKTKKAGLQSPEKAKKASLMVMPECLLPLVTASPILEEDEDLAASQDDCQLITNKKPDEPGEKEILSASMQSLVNGLMNWGEQYDSEDDYALPAGMAASIVLEGSDAFKVPN